MIGKQAFPSHEPGTRSNLSGNYYKGMLLVDYFASEALNALILKQDHNAVDLIARDSYQHAIAMMKERERLKQSGVI